MKVNITYPPIPKKEFKRNNLLKIMRPPMLLSAIACPIVNICVGGKAWSVVVLLGLYMLWDLAISTDLVEYNRISQWCKFAVYSTIMLACIELFLAAGWALMVIPIVCFSSLVVSAVLFFTDIKRQKQNMMPIFLFTVGSIIGSAIMLIFWHSPIDNWPIIVWCAVSSGLLIAFLIVLKGDFIRELKRRFHVK